MEIQSIGYLSYRLYQLGWHNRLYARLPRLQHWLLSIFLYYRRGYANGSEWVKEYKLNRNS